MNTKIEIMKNEYYDFKRTPHIAVVGATGTGKSMLLTYLIYEVKKLGATVSIIDTKKGDLYALNRMLGYNDINTKDEIFKELEQIIETMNFRQDFYSSNKKIGVDFTDFDDKPHFLFIDELNATVRLFDKKEREKFNELLTQIIMRGRSGGINVVIGSQQLNANVLATELRDQISLKIFLANADDNNLKISRDMLFGSVLRYPKLKKEKFGGWYSNNSRVKTFISPNLSKFDVRTRFNDLRR